MKDGAAFSLGISEYFSLIKRKLGNTFDIDQSPDNLYSAISLPALHYSSLFTYCSCVSVGCCHYTHTNTERVSPAPLPLFVAYSPFEFYRFATGLHPKLFCLPTEGCPRCGCCCFCCSCWTIQCVFYWSGA